MDSTPDLPPLVSSQSTGVPFQSFILGDSIGIFKATFCSLKKNVILICSPPGEGAFGSIHKCTDAQTNVIYAVCFEFFFFALLIFFCEFRRKLNLSVQDFPNCFTNTKFSKQFHKLPGFRRFFGLELLVCEFFYFILLF